MWIWPFNIGISMIEMAMIGVFQKQLINNCRPMLRFPQIVITDTAWEISTRRKTETDTVMLLPTAPTSNLAAILFYRPFLLPDWNLLQLYFTLWNRLHFVIISDSWGYKIIKGSRKSLEKFKYNFVNQCGF